MRLLLILFIFLSKINAETLIHTSMYIDGISDASKTNSSIIVENGKLVVDKPKNIGQKICSCFSSSA